MGRRAKAIENELLEFAATFPGASVETPWDHSVVKVRGKVFVFFGGAAGPQDMLSMTVKLPISAEMALTLPGAERAGYGLGKSGWVAYRQASATAIDTRTCKGWIAQSYRAVAPRKLSAQIGDFGPDS